MKTLQGQELTCAYNGHDILKQLSIAAQPGEVLGLIGPNGVGKTTLLRSLARLLPPRHGWVVLGDRDLYDMAPKAVARDLALTPQSNPNWPLTVEQVVSLGRAPHRGWLLPLSSHDARIVEETLQRTGLAALRDRTLPELSGGEQKRVILARALCQEPRVLLLDEPTAYLDLKYQSEILSLIRGLAHDDGLTVVVTMHDLNQAALYADRLALLVDGELLALGPPRAVLTEANLARAYGVPVVVAEHPVYHTPLITPLMESRERPAAASLAEGSIPRAKTA
ncbi:MAG: ABC transporter ATP-binding protein [Chloroflexi bacterium]|nr:ABC transporter ATP-binding protein [Chloroflexota bacterium]